MTQRGRKGDKGPIVSLMPHEYPARPEQLPPYAADIWNRVVRGMRHDWFSTSFAFLLETYCFHCWQAHLIEVSALPVADKRHAKLVGQHRQESKLLMTLASRLRLTPSSNRALRDNYDPLRGKPKPWEYEGPQSA
jgi:phage terminase small subunit